MHTHGTKFTDRGDEEELIDTNIGGVHSMDKDLQPSKVCSKRNIWAQSADYAVKFLLLNGSIHTHGPKFRRRR